MNQCLKISITRGGCRFATPLYLGSSYVLSFEGDRSDEASRVVFVNPLSKDSADIDGIVVLAESIIVDEETILSLNRNALVEWFKSNSAFGVESTVDAHCYVFNDKGDVLADSPVTIEYSPTLFIIDSNDYPLAKEVLLQAISAKNQAIEAKDSAISAKDSAVSAKSAAENAMIAAENAKKITQEASSDAKEAAITSSVARDDAISARNSAHDAKDAAKKYASTVETALGKMIASAKKVVGGVEVLLWNGQGNEPVPIFIPNGIDGVTGYVRCDEDGKYYCLKCKEVDGEKVIVLVQTGVDSVAQEGYVRAVNGNTPDKTGNVNVPIDFLPLSGGTINGTIIISGEAIALKKDTDSRAVQIIGGINAENNACLNLYGKNYPTDTHKGAFLLVANDGTDTTELIGLPNGELTWGGSSVFLPTGSVFAFAANKQPAGCLLCNGATVSRTTYAKLFNVIGTTYGSGDGSTTFNLPNLTDRFIQGSGTAGTVKEAGLPDHTHTTVLALGGTWDNSYGGSKKVAGADYDSSHNAKPNLTNASKSNSIYGKSNTVQPPALTMRYYIKY